MTNLSKWNEKTQVKKGDIGEAIVRGLLEKYGWIVLKPVTNAAHYFDMLSIKPKSEEFKAFIVEVKTKAKRNLRNDTGIDVKHYESYQKVAREMNISLFLCFVDEMLCKVYGASLDKLSKQYVDKGGYIYPLIEENKFGKIIYFSLDVMQDIYDLSNVEVESIKNFNRRNYDYKDTAPTAIGNGTISTNYGNIVHKNNTFIPNYNNFSKRKI